MDLKELVKEINSKDYWVFEEIRTLCEYAGLSDELDQAEPEQVENVIYKAAEILHIDL